MLRPPGTGDVDSRDFTSFGQSLFGKRAGILRGVEFALRSPLDLIPGPKAPLSGLVNRQLGDLEMQKDLTPMVALVAERVTKKRHRAQLDSLHAPATFPFGEQLPHGLTGID